MRRVLTVLMLGNAALFLFGALQHAGLAIGPLREPAIIPASVVELLCALALIWGAAAVLTRSLKAWRAALIGNLVPTAGVGPRTATNDVYHRIMLALAAASLVILFVPAGRQALKGH